MLDNNYYSQITTRMEHKYLLCSICRPERKQRKTLQSTTLPENRNEMTRTGHTNANSSTLSGLGTTYG